MPKKNTVANENKVKSVEENKPTDADCGTKNSEETSNDDGANKNLLEIKEAAATTDDGTDKSKPPAIVNLSADLSKFLLILN